MGRGQQLGITIGTAFGLVYVLLNSAALPGTAATALRVVAVLLFLGVQVAMRRGPAAESDAPAGGPPSRYGRGFWTVAALEVVALVVGVRVLAQVFDLGDAGVAWVSLVVGVHFIALAVLWRESTLHVLAAGLTLCGLAGLVLAFTGAPTAAVATVGGVVPGFWMLAGGAAAVVVARPRERQAV